ncbi:hypothetical protein PIB30_081444 [Stylosanthes scabra]|uniref:Uncharacterized protein n=1 Tax=Stylosanthes scabra TaxID=79078 RepID=A0ABU6TR94_9FABA|nr:hypothetical protein [Stylosanthes scabra]
MLRSGHLTIVQMTVNGVPSLNDQSKVLKTGLERLVEPRTGILFGSFTIRGFQDSENWTGPADRTANRHPFRLELDCEIGNQQTVQKSVNQLGTGRLDRTRTQSPLPFAVVDVVRPAGHLVSQITRLKTGSRLQHWENHCAATTVLTNFNAGQPRAATTILTVTPFASSSPL